MLPSCFPKTMPGKQVRKKPLQHRDNFARHPMGSATGGKAVIVRRAAWQPHGKIPSSRFTPRNSACSRDPQTTPRRSSRRAILSMVARLSLAHSQCRPPNAGVP
jgi:hypothetical protein